MLWISHDCHICPAVIHHNPYDSTQIWWLVENICPLKVLLRYHHDKVINPKHRWNALFTKKYYCFASSNSTKLAPVPRTHPYIDYFGKPIKIFFLVSYKMYFLILIFLQKLSFKNFHKYEILQLKTFSFFCQNNHL